jgi:centrosomal protein CEP19
MNKAEKKFNSSDYAPKRFGLKYNPPQIVIEYLVPSTGKLYHHKIKIKKSEAPLQEIVKEIYEKHYPYLDNKKINPTQVVRLLEKLLNSKNNETQKSKEEKKQEKVDINELEDEDDDYYKFFDYENEDLNKLNDEELKKRKDQMEKLYEKNKVNPGDENYVFDVRVKIFF